MVFFAHAFLLLVCYYILKTLREPLLLAGGSAELKSYAYACIAALLLFLVPAYGAAFRRQKNRRKLFSWVTLFFATNLLFFYVARRLGADIGFVYYVWVGIFGVTILAQFWAYAADVLDVGRGQRLFPAVAAGAALGGLLGPPLVGALFAAVGPLPLLLAGAALLAATVPLIGAESATSVQPDRTEAPPRAPTLARFLGGFELVLRDRFLMLIAAFVVLLNCVNSTGEFLLTNLVLQRADDAIALNPSLNRGALVAEFYGAFYLAVNVLTVLSQVFLVSRLFRRVGVGGALMILPLMALIGYGIVFAVPVFGVVRCLKLFENSTDYSVTNTSRHALFLPLSAEGKYQGKLAIDTFCCRAGDLLHAGIVFVGLNWLLLEYQTFAIANVALAACWLGVAVRLAARYRAAVSLAQTLALPHPAQPLCSSSGRPVRPIPAPAWRRTLAPASLAALCAIVALSLPAPAGAATDSPREPLALVAPLPVGDAARIFDDSAPLELDVYLDLKALCRDPRRRHCPDSPASLVYLDGGGRKRQLEVKLRSRGRYRSETGHCRLPALFVFFADDTAGTLFDGQTMLPLTTHCQYFRPAYEQYVLKEYLAYRIYNLLTEKSLRVRLIRLTYHDRSGKYETFTRYSFFTEHFDELAKRLGAMVYEPEKFDPASADPNELARHDLFQYMIGNTDFSVIYAHNVVHLRDPDGHVTVVPYDFDFSGLVDAEYAGPAPALPIADVRQRLFRGICNAATEWAVLFAEMRTARQPVLALVDAVGLSGAEAREATAYLSEFFDSIDDFDPRQADSLPIRCRGALANLTKGLQNRFLGRPD